MVLNELSSDFYAANHSLRQPSKAFWIISLSYCFFILKSIAVNLHSYSRLTFEQPILKLTFKQLGEQRFEVEISYSTQSEKQRFLINGDEWQIDARIIKWHGWAQLPGLNAQYRLERIQWPL